MAIQQEFARLAPNNRWEHVRPPPRGMDDEEANVEKKPVVSQRAGSWEPERRKKKITRNGRQGACDKDGSPNRRKFVHKGRTATMSATVRGALARGTDLSTAPCYIKLTLSSRAHGGTRKCRVTK